MKARVKRVNKGLFILAIAGLMAFGCGQSGPASTLAPDTDSASNIRFIPLGDGATTPLAKKATVSKWINKHKGGRLSLQHKSGRVKVHVSLYIPPNSMSRSALVSASIENGTQFGETYIVFEPHGLTFSDPAIMNFEARNLDLEGLNPDDIKLYYVNENGDWEVQACDNIIIDIKHGSVKVLGARLDHFSRYVIGAL